MFNKHLFILAHQLGDPHFFSTYKKAIINQFKTYDELKQEQEKLLRKIIRFSYENVPFYHNIFNSLKISPEDIKKLEDLEKLPIINKDIIIQNWDDFKPLNLKKLRFYNIPTGGSTGTPMMFRISHYDRFLAGALLYRGWGYAGYKLGDKMVFLAGSSLNVGTKSFIITKAHEIARNLKKLSSFDMEIQEMENYTKIIKSFNPHFLRGYASSINFFANYVKENDKNIELDAVFTTAEKLYPKMRKNIENAFSCDVFDGYGLYDGGAGAYECTEHNGLHIDTERSIMEIVDEKGYQINTGLGRIIATSLHNYAMPFIRYDTGDLGHLVSDTCECGRGSRLLNEVIGRQQEMLQTPEGKFIHGEFFTHIFWEINGVKEFQVIQNKLDKIKIRMVLGKNFDDKQLDKIREIIKRRSSGWEIEFRCVDKIERTEAGKYKFVISELGE
jgi:phenylacetate-CoA ligase